MFQDGDVTVGKRDIILKKKMKKFFKALIVSERGLSNFHYLRFSEYHQIKMPKCHSNVTKVKRKFRIV